MKKIITISMVLIFWVCGVSFAESYKFGPEDLDEPQKTEPRGKDTKKYPADTENPYETPYRPKVKTYDSSYDSGRDDSRTAGSDSRLYDPFTKYTFEVNGNASAFEGNFHVRQPFVPNSLLFGINGLTSDEDFYSVSLDLAYGTLVLDQSLQFDIGFRGVWSQVESDDEDLNLGAVAFLARLEYDFPDIEVTYNRYIDIDVYAQICASPSPLSFGDADQYMEGKLGISVNLSADKRLALTTGFRYIRMEFDDERESSKKEDGPYLGFRLRF